MKEAGNTYIILLGLDLDTWEKIMSITGFVITVITLFVAENARRAVKKIQSSITFDKRIPQHIKAIDSNLKIFNSLLNNILLNIDEINSLLGSTLSEISSLKTKITDDKILSSINEAETQIRTIREISYTTNNDHNLFSRVKNYFSPPQQDLSDLIKMNYVQISEIYTAVGNIHKDSKTNLRRE